MNAKPSEAKQWAGEKLRGVITALMPTFTQDMKGLNEKAIAHDIREIVNQGYLGASIITEAGTTSSENKLFTEMAVKHAKGKILTVLLTTFSTVDENLEMVKFAREVGVDLIQLGYPSMWHPSSLDEVLGYTRTACEVSGLPTIVWAADMWGWCEMLEDSRRYPKDLLLKFAGIPNVVGIKSGTDDMKVLGELYSRGIVPGTVVEAFWPLWIKKFGALWGGISAYNHLYFCTEYFNLLLKGDWEKGMELYLKMNPIRKAWGEMIKAEVGSEDTSWAWTGHNRLRWKYAGWLVGLNGGPIRGWYRVSPGDMKTLRRAAVASEIPVTADKDAKFFEGRNPA